MNHIISISGGLGSAVAADRVIERYGRDSTTLWFADTLWEDADLYRFLDDCMARWGGELVRHCDGRTPMDVWRERQLIPMSGFMPCGDVLKIDPFTAFVSRFFWKPVTVHLGLAWGETSRLDAPRRRYHALSGVQVDFPLLWSDPVDLRAEVENWGVRVSRLYDIGFPHNNCGGRCPKGGHSGFRLLRQHFPKRFQEMVEFEQWSRAQGDTRANRAFLRDRRNGECKPLLLTELTS